MDGMRSRQTATGRSAGGTRFGKRGALKRDRAATRRVRRRRLGAAIETLEKRNLLTFAIDLVQDINTLGVSSRIDEVVQLGSESLFVADDGVTGSELWKTDGTVEGTVQVKDIAPGPDTADPAQLTVVGNEAFFVALDENGEEDLWKTDGTESGTVKVYDSEAEGIYYLTSLTESGGKLFFTAAHPTFSYELWVSDGTSAGTMMVDNLNLDEAAFDGPRDLVDVNGTLFFSNYDQTGYNREIWKSDGTAAGTMMVADLNAGPGLDGIPGTADDDASYGSYPTYLTNVNGVLFFAAEDTLDGVELYKSDGTEAGTMRVADLNPAGGSYPEELTAFLGELFYSADDGSGNRHLYKSDGTSISLVADTTAGMGSSTPVEFEVVGNELFFAASGVVPPTTMSAMSPTMTARNSRIAGGNYAGIVAEVTSPSGGLLAGFNSSIQFNSTNQTAADGNDNLPGSGWVDANARIGADGVGLTHIAPGDLYVEDIDPGEIQDNFWDWTITDAAGLTNISFAGFASGNEFETDTAGNAEGLLFELFLNGDFSSPVSTTTVFGNDMDNWLAGRDANNVNLSHPGGELTPGGELITSATARVSIGNSVFANYPNGGDEAFVVGATLTADLSPATTQLVDAGRELHKTDGTTAGTQLVKDIVPVGSSTPFQLTEAGGKLFFSADDVVGDGLELWVSDGTEAGTMQVVDSLPGNDLYGAPLDGAPQLFGEIGGSLLFTTTDPARDRELWISDGTGGGTSELANLNPSTDDAEVSDLIRIGTSLYFVADNGLDGEQIYKFNANTEQIEWSRDLSPASTDKISKLTVLDSVNDRIVFYNNTTNAIFTIDGDGNTTQVADVPPVELDDEGTMFVVAGNVVYFVTDDGTSGRELWKVTGAGSAQIVIDLIPGSTGSNPEELTSFAGALYFSANTNSSTSVLNSSGDVGRELFMTDGFNTFLAVDIRAGSADSSPEHLTVAGSNLFFSANDGSNGRELWRRGMDFSTSLVTNLNSGGNSSNPTELTDINGLLYFSANGGSGFEPFRTDSSGTSVISLGNLYPTGASSNPRDFFPALGETYFSADDGTNGRELWKTNGTSAGTTLVSDIQSGGGSEPVPLFDTGKRLILSAAGTTFNDRELWSTDGAAITLLVEDLYPPEFFGSNPDEFVEINGKIYFAATNGPNGRELFVMEEVAPEVMEVIIGGEPGGPEIEVQRSTVDLITVVFDGNVDVPASAIEVINRDTNTPLTSVIVNTRFESGKTYVEVTFGSGPYVVDRDPGSSTGQGNSLVDGNYQLNVLSSQVSSPVSGADMASDYQFGTVEADQFFRFFGDSDGDRDVDGQDYGRFGLTFLKVTEDPGYNDALDNDGDGDVDGQDYGQFGLRFLKTMDFS